MSIYDDVLAELEKGENASYPYLFGMAVGLLRGAARTPGDPILNELAGQFVRASDTYSERFRDRLVAQLSEPRPFTDYTDS